MAIRVAHNYNAGVLGAAYGTGRNKSRERRRKYELDLLRDQQRLAQRREELFQNRALRIGLAEQGQQFQLGRDQANRLFSAEQNEAQRKAYAERDKARLDFYGERDRADRDFTREREADALELEYIEEDRYAEPDKARLAEIRRERDAILSSERVSDRDNPDIQRKLSELRKEQAEIRARVLPKLSRADKLRQAIGDPAFEQYGHLPWVVDADGNASLPSGFKMPESPEVAAREKAERVRKEQAERRKRVEAIMKEETVSGVPRTLEQAVEEDARRQRAVGILEEQTEEPASSDTTTLPIGTIPGALPGEPGGAPFTEGLPPQQTKDTGFGQVDMGGDIGVVDVPVVGDQPSPQAEAVPQPDNLPFVSDKQQAVVAKRVDDFYSDIKLENPDSWTDKDAGKIYSKAEEGLRKLMNGRKSFADLTPDEQLEFGIYQQILDQAEAQQEINRNA